MTFKTAVSNLLSSLNLFIRLTYLLAIDNSFSFTSYALSKIGGDYFASQRALASSCEPLFASPERFEFPPKKYGNNALIW